MEQQTVVSRDVMVVRWWSFRMLLRSLVDLWSKDSLITYTTPTTTPQGFLHEPRVCTAILVSRVDTCSCVCLAKLNSLRLVSSKSCFRQQ
jgi:hypothetical protein